ncbi:hypothetical protein JHK86_018203 [Glycine max]|nr:hypothetical protein JHK86_018203 [Glycine max]
MARRVVAKRRRKKKEEEGEKEKGRRRNERSLQSKPGGCRSWLSSFESERERPGKEHKGWFIMVNDLSGSLVAATSMVTPFTASPGSDQ